MKNLIARFLIVAAMLLASIAYGDNFDALQQNQYYSVIYLTPLGGLTSAGISINNTGLVAGYSYLPDNGSMHGMLWQNTVPFEIGTFGGLNSAVLWPVKNNKGLIVGVAETDMADPYGENWSCSAFFPTITNNQCLGFILKNGVMNPLPTLGGNNGFASGANNRNQIVGWAENTTVDALCTPPQRFQFQAVIWGPNQDQIQELPPYPGDSAGAATAINDNGQVVGISGICDQAVGRFSAIHAVVWEKGKVTSLGNFGWLAWNTPTSINQQGDIVGFADVPGATLGGFRPNAFIRAKKDEVMQHIPLLAGNTRNLAYSINDHGQVVGQSYGGGISSRAFLWQNGVSVDLNTLTPPGSLPLVFANDINDRGEITGQAYDATTGELVPFLAIPPVGGFEAALSVSKLEGRESPKINLPEKILKQLLRRVSGGAELE